MKEWFEDYNPRQNAQHLIAHANLIISEYQEQGYTLTLRQLYYQFVARDLIENSQKSYKNLGAIIGKARKAGMIDWNAIEDRTRSLRGVSHWEDPSEIISSSAYSFRLDKWRLQPYRIEVWVEKEALAGVIGQVCRRLDIDYFSCRGYGSLSEMYRAGKRLAHYEDGNQDVVILHLGDHDPSGMDMTRDINDRLDMFAERSINIDRLALNMDQIEQYNPPPNFAKMSDSRAAEYVTEYGYDSWELDALDPAVLDDLITTAVLDHRNKEVWEREFKKEKKYRELLNKASDNWGEIVEFIEESL
jgi:hypothetical protein